MEKTTEATSTASTSEVDKVTPLTVILKTFAHYNPREHDKFQLHWETVPETAIDLCDERTQALYKLCHRYIHNTMLNTLATHPKSEDGKMENPKITETGFSEIVRRVWDGATVTLPSDIKIVLEEDIKIVVRRGTYEDEDTGALRWVRVLKNLDEHIMPDAIRTLEEEVQSLDASYGSSAS